MKILLKAQARLPGSQGTRFPILSHRPPMPSRTLARPISRAGRAAAWVGFYRPAGRSSGGLVSDKFY